MSLRAQPTMILNLGGEMLYILEQRLHAQNVMKDKTEKVISDIVRTMFSKHFMDEIFRPQKLYSKKAMRSVFDRIAHSSVMRLNAASMDKLYDLMTMGVKHQFQTCLQPRDILFITLNHLDAILQMVKDSPTVLHTVQVVNDKFIKIYSELSDGDFQILRQVALNFFQDSHIRVSVYLKENIQNPDGSFTLARSGQVAWCVEIPIVIRSYDENGKLVKSTSGNPGGRYLPSVKGSTEANANRGTKLGCNLYIDSKHLLTADSRNKNMTCRGGPDMADPSSDNNALAQLQLLSRLIGMASTSEKPEIELNLLGHLTDDGGDSDGIVTQPPTIRDATKSVPIKIDASKHKESSEELSRIMGEMSVTLPQDRRSGADDGGGNGGDDADTSDLLELMDSLGE
ncbi:protein OSCP1-like [Argonauta hians]